MPSTPAPIACTTSCCRPSRRRSTPASGPSWSDFTTLPAFPAPHRELLRELLRDRWGFDGMIVSDYTAILELVHHGVAAYAKEAALLAFSAGVDLDLMSVLYARPLPGDRERTSLN